MGEQMRQGGWYNSDITGMLNEPWKTEPYSHSELSQDDESRAEKYSEGFRASSNRF